MHQPNLSPMIGRARHSGALMLILLCLLGAAFWIAPARVSAQTNAHACDAVRFLIENDTVPYALDLGGGVIQPGQAVTSTLNEGAYADIWALNVVRPTNNFGTILNATLTLRFDTVDSDLGLEVSVFREMDPQADDSGVEDFQPVTAGATFTYTFIRDGAYTIVIRRVDVSRQITGSYTFLPQFDGGGEIELNNLRDDSAGSFLEIPPQLVSGRQIVTIPGTHIEAHPAAPTLVASFNGNAVGVRYSVPGNNYGLRLNDWADNLYLLGGDLAAAGNDTSPERRVFYMQDYGYRFNMTDGDLLNVVDSNGTRLSLSWDFVRGVWITRDCAGFRLADGHTFTGIIDRDERDITFRGPEDDFTIRLVSFDPAGQPQSYRIDLGWAGVAENSEMTLSGGVLTAALDGERAIALESTLIDMRRLPAPPTELMTENIPLAVTMTDRDTTLLLDWVDMRRLSLVGQMLEFEFIDEPRDVTTRSATDLLRVEALDNVIRIIYKEVSEGVPGEERLLLSRAESYVEIVTPAGFPEFDGRALPGQPGYSPRALNNTGGECYPVNTALPEANCPPNGHPNPANGNLWYAVTDHAAYGGLIDLTLTRSYNSAYAAVDGPFGRGWTTPYLLDYNVAFNPETGSRTITPAEYTGYPVGLDLTYAPRGLVTFITPSGSRHLFASQSDDFDGGELVALTMPGWVLRRDSVRDTRWSLWQDTGLEYQFDRAGRLTQYGYPQTGRVLNINYPRSTLGGPASLGAETAVVITDAATSRRIELYYNTRHHVIRSVLRETRGLSLNALDTSACDITANCFETRYRYNGDLLVGVEYPDGQRATYEYDESGQMVAHDDPLAPVAQSMTYTVEADGALCINIPGLAVASEASSDEDASLCNWRRVNPPVIETDARDNPIERRVTVTGQWGEATTSIYRLADGELKEVGDAFTLVRTVSPLASLEEFEEQPRVFEWENGLLVREPPRQIVGDIGRNSVSYDYAPNGAIARVRGGYPPFNVTYTTTEALPLHYLPQIITYGDGSGEAFTYDENGDILTYTDRDGGVYDFVWDSRHRLIRVTSRDDGTVSAYEYNPLGQVSAVARHRAGEDRTTWHIVRYSYDGLGRLITVDDPLTGIYTVEYLPPGIEDAAVSTGIQITDATGSITATHYNGHGQLIETRLWSGDDPETYLRRTTFTYDVLGRLETENRWLLPPADALNDNGEPLPPQPVTTRYAYRPVQSLRSLQGDDATLNLFFSGYAVDMFDPLGRTTSITYDALGRVREAEDPFGLVTRYNYAVRAANSVNALRISEQQARGGSVFSSTEYLFDFRWQLRNVIRDGREWAIFYDGNSTRLRGIEALGAGIAFQDWPAYAGSRPVSVDVLQDPTISQARRNLAVDYDFKGRPLVTTGGDGVRYAVAYCPVDGGGERAVYRRFAPDAEQTDLCATAVFDSAVTTDAAGRPVEVRTGETTHAYTYVAQAGGWQIDIAFTGPDATAAWSLRYNSAGDLLQWIDENGITHRYEYDTLGRLVRVEVPDAPEASYTFSYNEGDLLTASVDDLGRGTTYVYSERGQLAVAQDVRTGNATIYGYNAAGWLASVISPLGNTTTYLYDDLGRLTGINGATGSQQRFEWDDDARTLTYIDPRENRIVYEFDAFGTVWRITDALGRLHELDYDSAGNLTAWLQADNDETGAVRSLSFAYPEPGAITLTETSDGLAWARTLRHDAQGRLESLQLGDTNALAFTYDPLGRVQSINAAQRTWQFEYVTGQPVIRIADGFGGTRTVVMDALNRMVIDSSDEGDAIYEYSTTRGAEVDLLWDDTVYTYVPGDAAGNPPSIIRRTPGQRVSYLYNADGLLSEIVTQLCLEFDPATDLLDLLTPDACVRTNPDRVRRTSERFLYDAAGRPIRYIDAADNIATYAYDDDGNLINFQNVQGQSFNYAYDDLNRLTSLSGPTGIRLLLRYNNADLVDGICQSRAGSQADYATCVEDGGELETYAYDALGRLIQQRYPNQGGETAVDYAYASRDDGLLSGWRVGDGGGVAIDRDPLGLVTGITTTSSAYTVNYDSADRITSISPNTDFDGQSPLAETYTYDENGRLATLTAAGHTLEYTYDDANGYTVRDQASGAGLAFRLDARGLLATIDYLPGIYDTSAGASGVDVAFEYFLNPDRRVVTVQVNWTNGELIELQIDRLGAIRSVAYVRNNLFVDFVSDAVGQIQRENIIGPQRFFGFESNGYIVQSGYDNDNRPLNLRVTNRANGELIYLLSFTYDSRGRYVGETRQYGDGTQTTITYRYDDTLNQLTRRDVLITRSRSQNGETTDRRSASASFVVVVASAVWGLREPRKRHLAILAVAAGLFVTLALTFADGQTVGDTYSFEYAYDERGNMTTVTLLSDVDEVDAVCRTYTYDTANRLTRATVHNSDGEHSQLYDYDAFNRVVRTGADQRLIYVGDSRALLAAINDDINEDSRTEFYGQTAGASGFFRAQDGELTWLLTDGRDNILAIIAGEESSGPIWLLDPIGRVLPLGPPPSLVSPADRCDDLSRFLDTGENGNTRDTLAALRALAPPQILDPDAVWDAETNLYFIDGRVYHPAIGRFLQRDPLGPDVFGTIYAYPSRQYTPPVRPPQPAYESGLSALQSALALIDDAIRLNAAEIALSYAPHIAPNPVEPLSESLSAVTGITRGRLLRQIDFPVWLAQHYNLPGPYIDERGVLRIPADIAPGQGGRPGAFTAQTVALFGPSNDVMSGVEIAAPLDRLHALMDLHSRPERLFRTYTPFAWVPPRATISDVWTMDLPHFNSDMTPSAVFDWLPRPLASPQSSLAMLDTVTRVLELPDRDALDWVEDTIAGALPQTPVLPPADAEDWLGRWFIDDTLGITEMLASRWPRLPAPDVPALTLFNSGP